MWFRTRSLELSLKMGSMPKGNSLMKHQVGSARVVMDIHMNLFRLDSCGCLLN